MLQSPIKYDGKPAPASTAIYRLTGQFVARAHLSRTQRAWLAAALANGTAEVYPLTVKQAAEIARVPVLDITKRRRNGKPSNGRGGHFESLAEHIARSSPAERLDAGRIVGLDVVWDTMISPVLAEGQAKAAAAIHQAEQAASNSNTTA